MIGAAIAGRVAALAFAVIASCGGGIAACGDQADAPRPGTPGAAPSQSPVPAHWVLPWTAQVPNLVHGDRLDLVFDDTNVAHWGSDASVEWAAAECDWMGGEAIWSNDAAGYRMTCEDVDF